MSDGDAVDYAFGGEFEVGKTAPAISNCSDPFVLLTNQSDGLEDFWHSSIGPVGFVPSKLSICPRHCVHCRVYQLSQSKLGLVYNS